MKKYFITGIGTDVGKTIASAIVTEALTADYWKPVQSGMSERDGNTVKSLISNTKTFIHPEVYLLKEPISPHLAAAHEGIEIDPKKIQMPDTLNRLVIEGAGGILVPLTNNFFVADLIRQLNVECILVIRNYLGSINHSLLTIHFMQQAGIKIGGVIINGDPNESEEVIFNTYNLKIIGRIYPEKTFTKSIIKQYAEKFVLNL